MRVHPSAIQQIAEVFKEQWAKVLTDSLTRRSRKKTLTQIMFLFIYKSKKHHVKMKFKYIHLTPNFNSDDLNLISLVR